jgi:hypothetical protein
VTDATSSQRHHQQTATGRKKDLNPKNNEIISLYLTGGLRELKILL